MSDVKGMQVLFRIDIVPCWSQMNPIPPVMESFHGLLKDTAFSPGHIFENCGSKRVGVKSDQIITTVECRSDDGVIPALY